MRTSDLHVLTHPYCGGVACPIEDKIFRACGEQPCPTSSPTPSPTPQIIPPVQTPIMNMNCHVQTEPDALCPVQVLQANTDSLYTDVGATCTDNIAIGDVETEKVINENVQVHGEQFPNPGSLGIYSMNYSCINAVGVPSNGITRTVVVEDMECPTCDISGGDMAIEASFPFTDPGATCSDSFDGDLQVITEGSVNVEETGVYQITYKACDSSGNCNNDEHCPSGSHSYVRIVQVEDTLRPVLSLHHLNILEEESSDRRLRASTTTSGSTSSSSNLKNNSQAASIALSTKHSQVTTIAAMLTCLVALTAAATLLTRPSRAALKLDLDV